LIHVLISRCCRRIKAGAGEGEQVREERADGAEEDKKIENLV
jgi:hypothetical protein